MGQSMGITIDIDHSVPLLTQLVGQIKKAVLCDKISPGDALPSIRQLANDLELNNKTVAKAYRLLERASVIQTKGHRGTFFHPDAKVNSAAYRDPQETYAEQVHSANMAALGQLVAGIAHELNTPLGVLKSNVDLLQRSLGRLRELQERHEPDGEGQTARIVETLHRLAMASTQAVERAGTIVTDLRQFARLDEAELDRIDPHDCLERTLSLLSRRVGTGIEVHREFAELPPIDCYPKQLNQAFMNVLMNAAQSIDGKGSVFIETSTQGGDQILVQIRDEGCGIPAENLERIFDPGFTTKGVGVGTGLGLVIARQIVETHGGRIDVESQIQIGTTVSVFLPVVMPRSGP